MVSTSLKKFYVEIFEKVKYNPNTQLLMALRAITSRITYAAELIGNRHYKLEDKYDVKNALNRFYGESITRTMSTQDRRLHSEMTDAQMALVRGN